MTPKSGTAGNAIAPLAPKAVVDADVADPGEVSQAKARDLQLQSGKYGSAKIKPFKPLPPEEAEATEVSWIEIELVGEDDKPIAGERYEITLPDGSVTNGTLDQNGFARVQGFAPGSCKVSFPELDQDAWEEL